jgi:hypothetical protein
MQQLILVYLRQGNRACLFIEILSGGKDYIKIDQKILNQSDYLFFKNKKNNRMKFIKVIILFSISFTIFGQNVGVGLLNPTLAKLEVFGVMGTGLTSAAFGIDGAGISFHRNWPGIGFNQYQDNVSPGKFMANGAASVLYLNMVDEAFSFYGLGNGTKNNLTFTPFPTLTLYKSGTVGIGEVSSNQYSLWVARSPTDANGITASILGTQYTSHFAKGLNEDTYISGGKDNSKVFINDIVGGSTLIGGSTSISDINAPAIASNTILNVEGGIAFTKRDDFEICNGGSGAIYTPGNSSYVSVKRTGCTTLQPFLIANGISDGQFLIVQIEGNNDFTIYSQNNIRLADNNDRVVGGGDIMVLYWNDITHKWSQLTFSDN